MIYKNKSKNPIKDVVLAVTYKCNSRCAFCNIWKSKQTHLLRPADFKMLPRGLRNINVSGGEPFLRVDLPEIVRTLSHQCPKAKITISTNGFTPCAIKKCIAKIMLFKRDIGVSVSIDGFGKAHEDMRNFPGGFSLAMETLRLLKEMSVSHLRVAFTLTDNNISQLKKVYELSKEMGVEFSLSVCHNSRHFFQKNSNVIRKAREMEKALCWLANKELSGFSPKKWIRAYFAWAAIHFVKTGKRVLPDYSGISSIFIDPFGKIYPSNVWGLEVGQLVRMRDWSAFSQRMKEFSETAKAPESWMICTARQAIKRHWPKVLIWVIKAKLVGFKRRKRGNNLNSELFSLNLWKKTS